MDTRRRFTLGKLITLAILILIIGAGAYLIANRGKAKKVEMPMTSKVHTMGEDVYLAPEVQKLISVKVEPVAARFLTKTLRTVGKIAFNEARRVYVTARIPGRVDELLVNYTGYHLRKDEKLLSLYSPTFLSAQEEYLQAVGALKDGGLSDEDRAMNRALLESTRRKLVLWGVAEKDIEMIVHHGQPMLYLPIYSPLAGTVIEKNVLRGQYVEEGEKLFTITDLSNVWMNAEVYEQDLSGIRLGQMVMVKSPSYPGEVFHGHVTFIDSVVQPETRTVRIRAELANPGIKLKPEMYVDTELMVSTPGRVLAIPRTALLDTGTRKLVYLLKEKNVFTPRGVEVGEAFGDYYPVVSGLRAGEPVVTSGNFLIDSQTQLGAAMGGMHMGMETPKEAPGKKPKGPEKEPEGMEMKGMEMGH